MPQTTPTVQKRRRKRTNSAPGCPKGMLNHWRLKSQSNEITLLQPHNFQAPGIGSSPLSYTSTPGSHFVSEEPGGPPPSEDPVSPRFVTSPRFITSPRGQGPDSSPSSESSFSPPGTSSYIDWRFHSESPQSPRGGAPQPTPSAEQGIGSLSRSGPGVSLPRLVNLDHLSSLSPPGPLSPVGSPSMEESIRSFSAFSMEDPDSPRSPPAVFSPPISPRVRIRSAISLPTSPRRRSRTMSLPLTSLPYIHTFMRSMQDQLQHTPLGRSTSCSTSTSASGSGSNSSCSSPSRSRSPSPPRSRSISIPPIYGMSAPSSSHTSPSGSPISSHMESAFRPGSAFSPCTNDPSSYQSLRSSGERSHSAHGLPAHISLLLQEDQEFSRTSSMHSDQTSQQASTPSKMNISHLVS